jgi:hypothetical protein
MAVSSMAFTWWQISMTFEEAIERTRSEAAQRGFYWRDPVKAWIARPWVFFGRREIIVKTNAESRGSNIWAYFVENSGELIHISYIPR